MARISEKAVEIELALIVVGNAIVAPGDDVEEEVGPIAGTAAADRLSGAWRRIGRDVVFPAGAIQPGRRMRDKPDIAAGGAEPVTTGDDVLKRHRVGEGDLVERFPALLAGCVPRVGSPEKLPVICRPNVPTPAITNDRT